MLIRWEVRQIARRRRRRDMTVGGFHLTSWRPCWRYNTKEYVISSIVGSSRRGWLALSGASREIDCKPRVGTKRVVGHSRDERYELL